MRELNAEAKTHSEGTNLYKHTWEVCVLFVCVCVFLGEPAEYCWEQKMKGGEGRERPDREEVSVPGLLRSRASVRILQPAAAPHDLQDFYCTDRREGEIYSNHSGEVNSTRLRRDPKHLKQQLSLRSTFSRRIVDQRKKERGNSGVHFH